MNLLENHYFKMSDKNVLEMFRYLTANVELMQQGKSQIPQCRENFELNLAVCKNEMEKRNLNTAA